MLLISFSYANVIWDSKVPNNVVTTYANISFDFLNWFCANTLNNPNIMGKELA